MPSAVVQNVPETNDQDIVLNTEQDLSTKVYCFVKGTTAGEVVLAESGSPVGVLQNAPKAASGAPQGAQVRTGGLSRLVAGGTVTVGDFLKPTTGGVAVKADTDKDVYGAQALEDGVTGDYIAVRVIGGTLRV